MPKISIELNEFEYDMIKELADMQDMRHTIYARDLLVSKLTNPTIVRIEKLLEEFSFIVRMQEKLDAKEFITDSDSAKNKEYLERYCDPDDIVDRTRIINIIYERCEVLEQWLRDEKIMMTKRKIAQRPKPLSEDVIQSAFNSSFF